VKGIDVLVRAVKKIPASVRLTLVVHAVGEGSEEIAYKESVCELARDDPRISIQPPLAREQIPDALGSADALAVPSLWLETGPLVVLEAQAAGVPVIGSRLGGISELVREPENGILVRPGDEAAWALAIQAFAAQPRRRRSVPTSIRTMRETAEEMTALYDDLIFGASRNPSVARAAHLT
jgi:glycosyltransferase involved in cell wall biosynthesis